MIAGNLILIEILLISFYTSWMGSRGPIAHEIGSEYFLCQVCAYVFARCILFIYYIIMFEQINKQYPQFHFRYLSPQDYHNGLYDTLNQLTNAPKPTQSDFLLFLQKIKTSNQKHINIVGVEKKTKRVIAFGTLLVCVGSNFRTGKIENIVTSKVVRGKGLGRCIIQILKVEGWRSNCQKIGLYCQQKNVQFYNKLGFKTQGTIYACYKK